MQLPFYAVWVQIRLEEEGAKVLVVGSHPAGMKYTGKYGYPINSDLAATDLPSTDEVRHTAASRNACELVTLPQSHLPCVRFLRCTRSCCLAGLRRTT